MTNGRLTSAAHDPTADAARELAQQLDVGVDQIAIAAALAQPSAWRVLSGASPPGQLAENLAGEQLHLDAYAVSTLIGSAQPPAQYWSERASRQWS